MIGAFAGVHPGEQVGKEEEAQHGEEDEELHEDNGPERAPQGHRAEPVDIESGYFAERLHRFRSFSLQR